MQFLTDDPVHKGLVLPRGWLAMSLHFAAIVFHVLVFGRWAAFKVSSTKDDGDAAPKEDGGGGNAAAPKPPERTRPSGDEAPAAVATDGEIDDALAAMRTGSNMIEET